MIGLGIRAWASGHLRKNVRLAVSGPYAYSRNPLYFGSALMLSGALISSGNLFLAIGLLSLFLLVYYPVMSAESERMRSLFGTEYDRWEATVPLFIPRLAPSRVDSGERFQAELYFQHREYRAFIGLTALYAMLALKLFLWR
jgi:protein-S-isoprenylcysteine O-methyltransferase Ste14